MKNPPDGKSSKIRNSRRSLPPKPIEKIIYENGIKSESKPDLAVIRTLYLPNEIKNGTPNLVRQSL
jgi:hypothetical protein